MFWLNRYNIGNFWKDTLRPIGHLRHFFHYLRHYRVKLIIVIFLTIITSTVPLVFPHLFRIIIDTAYPARNLRLFWGIGLLIVVLTSVISAMRGYNEYLSTYMNYHISCRIQMRILRIAHRLRMSYLEKTGPSELIERMSFDSQEVAGTLVAMFPELFSIPILLIVTFVLMVRISIVVTLLVLAIIPLYSFVTLIASSILRKLKQKLRKQVERTKNVINENFYGAEVLRFFSLQKKIQQKSYKDALKTKTRLQMTIWQKSFIYNRISELITSGWGFALTFGSLFLMFKGRLQVGETMALGMYVVILMRPFNKILSLYRIMMSASVSAQRILELNKFQLPSLPQSIFTSQDIHKGLDVCDISFSYNPPKVILQNISFHLGPGETLAIVGTNGSGKTTLLKLIASYYTNYAGKIFFGNKELRNISSKSYLEYVAMVWAENHFFEGTILENCRTKTGADYDEIQKIACALGFDTWIRKLDSGYDSMLGNTGIKLSSGESRKIAILRALIKNHSILLIDELNSCLDIESEHNLLKGLASLRPRDSITIFVTHKLDITMQPWVNQVAVLSEGALIQYGTPEQLLKEKGFYSYYLNPGRESLIPQKEGVLP